jgi:hypothetical protein
MENSCSTDKKTFLNYTGFKEESLTSFKNRLKQGLILYHAMIELLNVRFAALISLTQAEFKHRMITAWLW